MKLLINQRGYALIIVLLMIVLFLGASATFLASSLNHSTQERTIDTSNQAVTSAEMGVFYYTEDFQRYLNLEKKTIAVEILEKLEVIDSCEDCDAEERQNDKEILDSQMKQKFIGRIGEKVNQMNSGGALYSRKVSDDGRMRYKVDSAEATPSPTSSPDKIKISFIIKGHAEQGEAKSAKDLTVTFNVNIPPSFLKTDIVYEDIYQSNLPAISCSDLLVNNAHTNAGSPPYKCNLGGQTLEALVTSIEDAELDPKLFQAYTDDFLQYVCRPPGNGSNCNSENYSDIGVVLINASNTIARNMNSISDLKIYVDGKLTIENNLNNLEDSFLVLKELVVNNNINNMKETTLAVLGYDDILDHAEFKVGNNFSATDNSLICIDIDRIKEDDLEALSLKLTLDETSSLIYYTRTVDPNKKVFSLSGTSNSRVEPETVYSNFLERCGVVDASYYTAPNMPDSDFNFDVNYE